MSPVFFPALACRQVPVFSSLSLKCMQLATRCVRQKCKPITVHVLTGINVKAEIHYTGTRVCDHIWITQRSHSNNKRGKTKQGCTLPRKAGRPGYVFLPHTAILFPLILDVCIVGDGDRQWDSTVKKTAVVYTEEFSVYLLFKKKRRMLITV